jgi:selenocysteine lyase/cysteine desulfurase
MTDSQDPPPTAAPEAPGAAATGDPATGRTLRRRGFLKAMVVTGVAAGVGWQGSAFANDTGPAASLATSGPADWRRLFVLDRDPLFMNVGTVGSPPRAVLETLEDEQRLVARQALSDYHFTFDAVRGQIGAGLGADSDEIYMSSNTTDGVCAVLAGLALREGDEILTTNMEHPAAATPMTVLRDRRGVVINKVALPVGSGVRAEDLVALFENAVTSRTRVLLFSAPVFRTGIMLPIRMLAEVAQRHGLTSVVDGAHIPGMFALKFRELGVDFLAGSGAKWQCGPARTGVLYLRNKVLPQFNPNPLPVFWPTVTSSMTYPAQGGLPPRTTTSVASYDVGALLQDEGNPSLAQINALTTVCSMWDTIGRQRIQDYVLGLAQHLKERIAERWGASALYSARDDKRLASALTTFNPFANPADVLDLNKANTFVTRLHDEEHITIRNVMVPVIGSAGLHFPIRVSTHLFHDLHDVERFIASAWRLSRSMA